MKKLLVLLLLIATSVIAGDAIFIGPSTDSSVTSSTTYLAPATFNDDISLNFGTSSDAKILWETVDANANALLVAMPEGDSVNVPCAIFGDATLVNLDMGSFNSITDPCIAVMSDDASGGISLTHDGTDASIRSVEGDLRVYPFTGSRFDISGLGEQNVTLADGTQGYTATFSTSGAGSATRSGAGFTLSAGSTTSGFTSTFFADNTVAGTSTSYISDVGAGASGYGYRPNGNRGLNGYAHALTTGNNIGGLFTAGAGTVNYGLFASATAAKNSSTNVGVYGNGLNGGSTPVQIGGFFTNYNGGGVNTAPTLGTSAALVADNVAETTDIFSARDNGTAVFKIADGGLISMPSASVISGGSNYANWFNNCSIIRATTANAGDSVKLTSADGSALSATNVCSITMPSTTAGQVSIFHVTSDVIILLTGAVWTLNSADVTGALLRYVLVNDNGTLRHCIAYVGNRQTILTTDTSATQANIDTAEELLCNAAVSSATNTTRELGYLRADFDTTGGAAENLWAVQSGVDDLVIGRSPDGIWQPFNTTFGGFSSNPTVTSSRFTQIGRTIKIVFQRNAVGTSNATSYTMTGPAKSRNSDITGGVIMRMTDNTADVTTQGRIDTTAGSTTLTLYKTPAAAAWTNTGSKAADVILEYEVGPSASFVE